MSALKRPRHPMPSDVEAVLVNRGLMDAYRARPDYQQNDWIAWIERARRNDTRQKRLDQMLEELAAGEGYMGMEWHPRHETAAPDKGDA